MRKKNELKILATGEQYIKDDDKRKIIERWFDCSNILTGQLHMCNKKWVDVISWEDIEGQEMDDNNTKKYCDVKCPRCKKITRCAEAIIYNAALEGGFPTMIYEEGVNISYIPESEVGSPSPSKSLVVPPIPTRYDKDEEVVVQPSKFKWLIASAILLIVMLSLFVSVFNFVVN
jgi:hypothetical protein